MRTNDGERANHVVDGDPFGDTEDDFDASFGRFGDRISRACCWNEDAARVRAGLAHRIGHGVKHRDAVIKCALATATRRDAGNDLRAVRRHLRGMESAFATGEPLNNETRLLSN